jgi:hypothetical protein
VHPGEAYGPESIYSAITDLYAARIGHGYHMYHPNAIIDPKIGDKEAYTRKLREFMANKNTVIEVCLTSNLQTLPSLQKEGLHTHPLGSMLDDHLKVHAHTHTHYTHTHAHTHTHTHTHTYRSCCARTTRSSARRPSAESWHWRRCTFRSFRTMSLSGMPSRNFQLPDF